MVGRVGRVGRVVEVGRGKWEHKGRVVDLWESADEDKLAELILYVAEQELTDPRGGATKINKILYFAECSHVRAHGIPITGARYQKLKNGPAPKRLKPIRDRLIAQEHAEMRIDDYFGRELHRLVPLRAPDRSLFSGEELRIVDQVIEALFSKTADDVSDMSHQERAWELFDFGEDIPLCTAFLTKRNAPNDRVRQRAEELAAELGILANSQ
jgi:hypothetical protein